jgi:chromosome segregation ATPase
VLREAARSISAANEVLAQVLPVAAEDSSRLAVLAEQVEEINLIVAQADARAAAGELENAESLYRSALRAIDGTERAATRLLAIEDQRFQEQLADQADEARAQLARVNAQLRDSRSTVTTLREQVASLTSERDQLATDVDELQTGLARAEAATDAARQSASELGATVTDLRAEIARLTTRVGEREARIAALEQERERTASDAAREIADLRATVSSMETAMDETAAALTRTAGEVAEELDRTADAYDGPEVIDLLSTRVLLRAVVDSPSVREQYPRLYEDMETYFTALSRSRMDEGRTAAYTQASEAVEALAAGMGITITTTTTPDTPTGYLDRVVGLLRGAITAVAGE